MKTIRGKDMLYSDWLRAAKRYGGEVGEAQVRKYMHDRYATETDKVDKIETFLFNLIWPEEES